MNILFTFTNDSGIVSTSARQEPDPVKWLQSHGYTENGYGIYIKSVGNIRGYARIVESVSPIQHPLFMAALTRLYGSALPKADGSVETPAGLITYEGWDVCIGGEKSDALTFILDGIGVS